jgi:ANTAR domain
VADRGRLPGRPDPATDALTPPTPCPRRTEEDSDRYRALVPDGNGPAGPEGAAELRRELAAERDLTAQLRAALTSRAVIDQAIGILMAQQSCTADKAFEILRLASQNRNVKLRHVAADIITDLTGQPPFRPPGRPAAPAGIPSHADAGLGSRH